MSKQFSRASKILALQPYSFPIPVNNQEVCQAFDSKKKRVMSYRLIFIAFGVLFTILATILFLKTPNWNYNALFGYGMSAKTLLSTMTWGLGIASLWIGCALRTEHELSREFCKKMRNKLIHSYKHKKTYSLLGTFAENPERVAYEIQLRQAFSKAIEDMELVFQEAESKLDDLHHSTNPESVKKILKIEILSRLKGRLELTYERFDQI
jgi:hypothetical protein